MSAHATALLCQLREQLARHYPRWGVTGLEVAGAGLTFLVCRAESAAFGPVAIRVPWRRVIAGHNDGVVEARRLLRQEAALANHARSHGLPSPMAHALHLGDDGFDFLVSTYVPHDGSPPDGRAFGRLVRAIHDCPAPAIELVGQGGLPPSRLIGARLAQRASAVGRLTRARLPLPAACALAALLACRDDRRALLHMDARPANLFTREGAIAGIADWGDALVGDPALELARIAEYGHLDAAFLTGYGDAQALDRLPAAVDTIYRLDTVVMLAIVFLAEAPDREMADRMVRRAAALAASLAGS